MTFIHETLYGLFRDPYKALKAAGLKSNRKVLEVGCGPGFFTIPAAKIVGEKGIVCAIDINPMAIISVQQKIKKENITNVKTLLANAAKIELPDQSFDLIFLFGLTRPIGNMEKIWIELHRLLVSNGILSIEGRLKPPTELFKYKMRQRRISQYIKNVL